MESQPFWFLICTFIFFMMVIRSVEVSLGLFEGLHVLLWSEPLIDSQKLELLLKHK